MERRVKERLVGATILVVLVVLFVPEMLSGPKRPSTQAPAPAPAEAMRNVTVDLATSKATAADEAAASAAPAPVAAEMPAAASAATAPVTAATTPDESAPGEAASGVATSGVATPGKSPTITTLQAQQPAPPPAPLEKDVPPPRSTTAPAKAGAAHNAWAVQLGSFANHANAQALVRGLKAHNFPAYVSAIGAGKSLRYRVRVGPMAERAGADTMIARLKKDGHAASVVAP